MPACQDLIDKYADNVAPTSRRKYVAAVARFVDFCQGDFSREKLVAYIRHLKRQGYSPGTIKKFDLTAVRRFYKVNCLDWPL